MSDVTHKVTSPAPGQSTAVHVRILTAKNERLSEALENARAQIAALKEHIENLGAPPCTFGFFLKQEADGSAEIMLAGRKMRVGVGPDVDLTTARPGQEVMLNEALTLVEISGFERIGDIAHVKELLDDERILVVVRGDDERVIRIAGSLADERLRVGDLVTIDAKSGFAFQRIPATEVQELVLEEVPDVDYHDIGGLGPQIEQVRDAIELPFMHPELFAEHGLRPPKGVLLYGPPGCGKTLIAKAVAHSLAQRAGEGTMAYFLNIKGPELLNKYVGETERHIRVIFSRAREKAVQGIPVVVFFDEMDSLFRTRGTGISSDVETTIVPQLLAEIDGVERLDNVVVIGASNREDMIDPAILRPGRLDVKIKVERPGREGAREIFSKYLTTDVPIHAAELDAHASVKLAVASIIDGVVAEMFEEAGANEFLEVTYAGGDREILYFKDFVSGAMIRNIVDRAKKSAIKDLISSGERGVKLEHLQAAWRQEFRENEDLPNTTNPDDWARISGKKGEQIVFIRTIAGSREVTAPRSDLK